VTVNEALAVLLGLNTLLPSTYPASLQVPIAVSIIFSPTTEHIAGVEELTVAVVVKPRVVDLLVLVKLANHGIPIGAQVLSE
jgi:hypothetical protein